MRLASVGLCALSLLGFAAGAAAKEKPKIDLPFVKGPYLGQRPPGKEPLLFAPGMVSTALSERDVAITPEGDEIYFGVMAGDVAAIFVARRAGMAWQLAEIAPFARDLRYFTLEPCLSADGKRIFFLSTRPPAGQEPRPGWGHQNIWACDRNPDGSWGEPFDLGAPVNTADDEFYPSVTASGTLYFSRTPHGKMEPALYRSKLSEGRYQEPERLPAPVNGAGLRYNASVDRKERWLVACSAGPDGKGSRYTAFFQRPDGSWTPGVDLGEEVNRPEGDAASASFSPDGKYLFFASRRAMPVAAPEGRPLTLDELVSAKGGPRNGSLDLYWVDASFLEALRQKALAEPPPPPETR